MLKQKRTIYLLFIAFIVTIGNLFGQERVVHQIDDNLYAYKYVNEEGEVKQKGYYKIIDNVFRPHGFWSDSFGTKAEFRNGNIVWIKPKGHKKYTKSDLEIEKLRSRIARLEEKITSI